MTARSTRLLAQVGILSARLGAARRVHRNFEARARLARFRPWGWVLAAVAWVYGLRVLLLFRGVDRRRQAIRAGLELIVDSHRPGRREAFKRAEAPDHADIPRP